MKRKNQGLSTMEIVIAAIILAAVVGGVVIVMKLFVDKPTPSDISKDGGRTKIVNDLAKQVQSEIEAANVEIVFDQDVNDSNISVLRIISEEGYKLYAYVDNCIYSSEIFSTAEFGEELDDVVAGAKAKAVDLTTMKEETKKADKYIETFFIDIPSQNVWGGKAEINIRFLDESGESNLNTEGKQAVYNRELVLYHGGDVPIVTLPPTPTPTVKPTDTPTPTNTPTPTSTPIPEITPDAPTPTEVPVEPSPTEAPVEPSPTEIPLPTEEPEPTEVRKSLGTQNQFIVRKNNAELTFAPDDAMVVITFYRSSEDDESGKKGTEVGGIGYKSYTNLVPEFTCICDHDVAFEEEVILSFPLADLKNAIEANGLKEFRVAGHGGFTIRNVEIVYYEN